MSDGGKRGIVLQNGCTDGNSAQILNGQLLTKDVTVDKDIQALIALFGTLPNDIVELLLSRAKTNPIKTFQDASTTPTVNATVTIPSNLSAILSGISLTQDDRVKNALETLITAISNLPINEAEELLNRTKYNPLRTSTSSAINRELLEAKINFSASGDNTVASSTSGGLKIYKIFLVVTTSTTLTFKDTTNTNLTGAMTVNGGGAIVLDVSDTPWFTTSGDFVINSSVASQVSGRVYYK